MRPVTIDVIFVRRSVAEMAPIAAELIEGIPDPGASASGPAWSVGDTARHLAATARAFADYLSGAEAPQGTTADISAVNTRRINELRDKSVPEVARLLREGIRDFLAASETLSSDAPFPWYDATPFDVASATGVLLGEIVVHGRDIALGMGRPWPIRPDHARAIIASGLALLPRYVNPGPAAGLRATYQVVIRGGSRFQIRFDGDAMTIEAAGERADCYISAEPVAFLLLTYGRIGQWGPILAGKLVAWGRKPWLALRLKGLLLNP